MSWATAVADMRLKLSDNPNDKLRAYKRVFGQIDGTNTIFKTFEFRRITDFTSGAAPLGIYKNQVRLTTGDIASDDVTTGFFTLAVAPSGSDVLEATYYIQFFYDTELEGFLRLATNWLGYGDTYSAIGEGLRPAALQYACGEAYQKLAMRFAEHLSETYRLEDSPDNDRFKIVDEYKRMGEDCRKEAENLRNQFYTRQGQSLQPLFGVNAGRVRNVEPSR